jgi:hypothetical protein
MVESGKASSQSARSDVAKATKCKVYHWSIELKIMHINIEINQARK